MDMESRRAATIIALAQVAATFGVYLMVLFVTAPYRKSGGYIPRDLAILQSTGLFLLAIPLGWICLALRLQPRGRDLRLGLVFYGGILYAVILLVAMVMLFARSFGEVDTFGP